MAAILHEGLIGIKKSKGTENRYLLIREDGILYYRNEEEAQEAAKTGREDLIRGRALKEDITGYDLVDGNLIVEAAGNQLAFCPLHEGDAEVWVQALQEMLGEHNEEVEEEEAAAHEEVEEEELAGEEADEERAAEGEEGHQEGEVQEGQEGHEAHEEEETYGDPIHQGYLLLSGKEKKYCMLTQTYFLAYSTQAAMEEEEPVLEIHLPDVVEFQESEEGGFVLKLASGKRMRVAIPEGEELSAWMDAWASAGHHQGATVTGNEEVLCEGSLEVSRRHGWDARYFVLLADRLDCYASMDDRKQGGEARSRMPIAEIPEIEREDTVFILSHQEKEFTVRAAGKEDADRWAAAWIKVLGAFGRSLTVSAASDQTSGGVASKALPVKASQETSRVPSPRLATGVPEPLQSGHFAVSSAASSRGPQKQASECLVELYPDRVQYFRTPVAGARGAPVLEGEFQIAAIVDLEILDMGFSAQLNDGSRVQFTGPKIGQLETWLETLNHIFNEQAAGPEPGLTQAAVDAPTHSEPAPDGLSLQDVLPLRAPPVHEGVLEVTLPGRPSWETKYAVLACDTIQLFSHHEEARKHSEPQTRVALAAVQDFKVKDTGFELVAGGATYSFRTIDKSHFMGWINSWGVVFNPEAARRAAKDQGTPMYQGTLLLMDRGQGKPHYAVALEDRIRFFMDAVAAQNPLAGRREIWAEDVEKVQVQHTGFVVTLAHGCVEMRVPPGDSMEAWVHTLQQLFKPAEDGPRAHGERAVVPPLKKSAFNPPARATPTGPPVPPDADSVARWLGSLEVQPLCHGMLRFHQGGNAHAHRWSALFSDRLDSWDWFSDAHSSTPPQYRIRMADVSGIHTSQGALVLNCRSLHINIGVASSEELSLWFNAILGALAPGSAAQKGDASAPAEGLSTQGWGFKAVQRRGGTASKDWVPRVATMTTSSKKGKEELGKRGPNLSGKRGIVINTHKDGHNAHTNISRQGIGEYSPFNSRGNITGPWLQPTSKGHTQKTPSEAGVKVVERAPSAPLMRPKRDSVGTIAMKITGPTKPKVSVGEPGTCAWLKITASDGRPAGEASLAKKRATSQPFGKVTDGGREDKGWARKPRCIANPDKLRCIGGAKIWNPRLL